VVPFREEMTKRHLKVAGDLGRVVFVEFDLRNTPSIEESVRHSDIVYNLIGRTYPTKCVIPCDWVFLCVLANGSGLLRGQELHTRGRPCRGHGAHRRGSGQV